MYLASSTTSNDALIPDCALDYHDSVMQTSVYFGDELLCSSSQHQSASLGRWAAFEEVVSLAANLPLLETLARAKMLFLDVRTCRRNAAAGGLNYSLEVIRGDTTSAEDVTVCKVSVVL